MTGTTVDDLALEFEAERQRLRAIAAGILGSAVEADDAVQEAWFRLHRIDRSQIASLPAWLTVVVSRIALDHVRARSSRREEPIETMTTFALRASGSAEADVIFDETVYEALAHALNRLSPLEAAAFILHDLFLVPFDEIAAIIERSAVATRKLASRARGKVSMREPGTHATTASHRQIVEAFMLAARSGDLEGLLSLLAPNAVLRGDESMARMGVQSELHGAAEIAGWFEGRAQVARMTWFDGVPGAAWAPGQRVRVAFTFEIEDGQVAGILLRADPDWLDRTEIEIEPRPRRKNAGRANPSGV